jgi:hypothetical protein
MALHRAHMDLGQKQETGTIRNNHCFTEVTESNPKARFVTETSERLLKLIIRFASPINHLPRSGFTLCNKFQYVHPVEAESEMV